MNNTPPAPQGQNALVTATRIVSLRPIQQDDGDYLFKAVVADHRGNEARATLSPDDLADYRAFRSAILRTTGALFDAASFDSDYGRDWRFDGAVAYALSESRRRFLRD